MFYDKFKELCAQKKISVSRAATDIGLSNSTPTKWKKTGATPDGSTLVRIADYFGVSVDALMGDSLLWLVAKDNGLDAAANLMEGVAAKEIVRQVNEKAPAPLNQRDERDIEKRLEALLGDLEGPEAAGLMFSGEPMDEETRDLLRISLRNQLELSKRIAKQKYTPNKYKEGD